MSANQTPTVVIDPGHGGTVAAGGSSPNNATGPNGLLEKDVTLDLGRRVAALLANRATVVLTRTGDENRSLADRARVARDANADVFLSIHLNGWRDPNVDGSEAWVATQAGAGSRTLARSVLDRVVGVTQARDRGVKEQDFGVLLPSRLGANTAASLVEVAFLTNPDEADRLSREQYRQQLATAIADGIAARLAGAAAQSPGLPAATALGTPDQDAAVATLTTFGGSTAPGAFTPHRDEVADRAIALVNDPTLVDQAGLPLCGPAAFLRLWIQRDPRAFATFMTTLYDSGSASIGSLSISAGSDLRHQDYYGRAIPAMRAMAGPPPDDPQNYVTPTADWVAMSSIRDSANTVLDFEGLPSETVSGLTQPGEVTGWLRATGLYSSVDDQANDFFVKGVDHAFGLRPDPNVDVVMLVNAHILTSAAAAGHKKSDQFILNAFPNHYVLLESQVTEPTPGQIEFRCWTWGQSTPVRIPRDVFERNYYGAIVARAAGPAPSSGLSVSLAVPGDPVIAAADSPVVRADRVIAAGACGLRTKADGSFEERVPEMVVIHVLDAAAGYDGEISNWHNGIGSERCFPPHYVVKNDGEVTQMVAEKFISAHANNFAMNTRAIGIEHDGFDNDPLDFTDEMYAGSAALVRDICNRRGIAVDRAHIIGHDEVPQTLDGTEHGDPGGYWDWDYYMALVRWDGVDQARKPLRDVMVTDGLSLGEASAQWHQADRDSGRADWRRSRTNMGALWFSGYGPNYLWADGAADAPDDDAIVYSYTVPQAGTWTVSAWWPMLEDANHATHIDVTTTRSGPTQPDAAMVVDQHLRASPRTRATAVLQATPMWFPLGGAFDLQPQDVITVRIKRRSDTRGKVIADAVRFLMTPSTP